MTELVRGGALLVLLVALVRWRRARRPKQAAFARRARGARAPPSPAERLRAAWQHRSALRRRLDDVFGQNRDLDALLYGSRALVSADVAANPGNLE